MIGATRYVAAAEIARQARLGEEIARLQTSVSTGKRLATASDDPVASSRVAEIRQDQANQSVWGRNVTTGAGIAAAADAKLVSIQSVLNRAKELVLAGRTATAAAGDRVAMANELRTLAADLGTFAQATDPTGRALFPVAQPIAIPVSAAVSMTATSTRAAVFEGIAVGAGTKSLATILTDAAAALDLADPIARTTGATASIGEVESGLAHLTAVRADQGLRAQRFDDAKDQLAAADTTATEERQGLEATDVTYALSAFQAKKLALDAAQAVFAQAHRSNLFSLLG